MIKPEIIKTLQEIEELPTLPAVAQQILSLLSDKRSNMNQIAMVIARDQAIAARVIRLVNSAFYGIRGNVSSIQHAIVILGLNTVKNLVLGVSVIKTFQDSARTTIFDREQFWLHTFATALGARMIAEELKLPEPDDYFLAGLLHDIGILVTDQFLHDEFMSILEGSLVKGNDFCAAEQLVLGAGHGEVGAFLASNWGVPVFLVDAMRYHHAPEGLPDTALASRQKIDVVHVADAKSREFGPGRFVENFAVVFSDAALKRVAVTQSRLDELFGQVNRDSANLMRDWGV